MKPCRAVLAILCASLLFTVGCSSNNKGKIEGTKWDNDETTIDGKVLAPGELYVEFKKDGKLVYGKFDGTYTLGAGDRVTFTFDQEVAGRKSHVETITIDGEKMTMADAKGKIVFSRIRDDKYDNTDWDNDPRESTGKYRDLGDAVIDLHLDQDGSVKSNGEKIGTYTQKPGESISITFNVKFRATEWKTKEMPVTDNRSFFLADSEGDKIKMKKR